VFRSTTPPLAAHPRHPHFPHSAAWPEGPPAPSPTIIALDPSQATLIALEHGPAGIPPRGETRQRTKSMSKEKNRGNREAKKPKKDKPKVLATANSNLGKPLDIGNSKKGK
jgi:hypothetical protein